MSREKKVKERGSSKEVMRWTEQPLIDILGSERKVETVEKYPICLAVRVLMLVGKKGFAPTAYADNTAFLANNDIMLAFLIQTRAGQMGKGSRDFHFDWGSLIVAGNLQKTAETKKSIAKIKHVKKSIDSRTAKSLKDGMKTLPGFASLQESRSLNRRKINNYLLRATVYQS